jgi:hypothetical protein
VSEYQYYEFRAIDRPLTDRQMQELRAISTRAAISRTSFSNYYTFGDLKANPRDLLAKYFDASLYFANWLYLEVTFSIPEGCRRRKGAPLLWSWPHARHSHDSTGHHRRHLDRE